MICTYCGAKYHKNEERCPYCNSENPKMAEKRKRTMIEALDREAKEMEQTLPKKKVKNMHKAIVIVIIGLLVLLLVGTIVGVVGSKISAKMEYTVYQRHTASLEEMFQNEDWDHFYEYMQENELWDSKYEKYGQVYDVGHYYKSYLYEEYSCYQDQLRQAKNSREPDSVKLYKDMSLQYLGYVFEDSAYILVQTQKNVNDRVILGNEKILKAWNEEVYLFLVRDVEMSEEDIEFLMKCESKEEMLGLAEKYFERDFDKETENNILKRN